MPSQSTCHALNRLWIIHNYSLATYLSYAPPWWSDEDGAAAQVLREVAEQHRQLTDRIRAMLVHYGEEVRAGRFPDLFTTMHDLSAQFLWVQLIEYQERTIAAIEKLIPQIAPGTIAQALAQECLGAAKAHLDMMQEIDTDLKRLPA